MLLESVCKRRVRFLRNGRASSDAHARSTFDAVRLMSTCGRQACLQGPENMSTGSDNRIPVELPLDDMRIRFRAGETVWFVSSSGHCNLDCSYCIIQPVAKHKPSLGLQDLRFLLDKATGPSFFIFSGIGDFFAGYKRDDRLLTQLLQDERTGGVALDINGVVIHCLEDLPVDLRPKIRHLNLTFHYQQLVDHKALKLWARNALHLLQTLDGPDLFVNFILSPPEAPVWAEALAWYRTHVFQPAGKPLILIADVNRPFGEAEEQVLRQLQSQQADLVHSVRRGGFEPVFEPFDHVRCGAGSSYFRVWNDGRIDACPNVPTFQAAGDTRARTILLRQEPVACNDLRHCDCYHVASAGQMEMVRV